MEKIEDFGVHANQVSAWSGRMRLQRGATWEGSSRCERPSIMPVPLAIRSPQIPCPDQACTPPTPPQYYPLEVSYFKSSLDAQLLGTLWNTYWIKTLCASPLLQNQALVTGQLQDVGECAPGFLPLPRGAYLWSWSGTDNPSVRLPGGFQQLQTP